MDKWVRNLEDDLKAVIPFIEDKRVTDIAIGIGGELIVEGMGMGKVFTGIFFDDATTSPTAGTDRDMSKKYAKTEEELADIKYTEGKGTVYEVEYKDGLITFNDMLDVPLEGKVEKGRFEGEDGAEIWDAFIAQMSLDDLIISVSDNRGILDVAKVLKKGNSVAEGPEGILSKFKYGDTSRWATGFPTGPTYTATFDHEMQKKFGGFFGEEALYCGVASVNAPGANINRVPYGSRASEYMSEDGVLNYNTAANIIGEARRKGLIMNIKHCFLNNQEDGRQRIETYCNEQAIREIYLRPFEGALTKGHGMGIMTSYNRIGATYAATHSNLMNGVMRGEWKYRGFIIDDALTGSNTDPYSNGPAMIHNGTDLFCLDGRRGGDLKNYVTQNDDLQILKDMQRANMYVMYALNQSWMGGLTEVSDEEIQANLNPWYLQAVTGAAIGLGSATAVVFGLYAFFEVMDRRKLA